MPSTQLPIHNLGNTSLFIVWKFYLLIKVSAGQFVCSKKSAACFADNCNFLESEEQVNENLSQNWREKIAEN